MNAVPTAANLYTLTINAAKEGLEYKYLAGPDWKYVEVREGGANRTYEPNDVVTAWTAVPEGPVTPPTPGEHIYSVAGSADVLGSNWNEKEGNELVKGNDGKYTLVKENVTLAATTYEYKVVIDHMWNNGEARDNSKLVIEKYGKYNVTFIYDADLPKDTAIAELIEEVVVIPQTKIAGIADNWAGTDMTLAADEKSASLTLTLEADSTYQFKVVIGSNWRSNGYRYHRDFTGAAGITMNENDNMTLAADVAGDYTFTWFYANDSLAITFPDQEPIEPSDYYAKYIARENATAWTWHGLKPIAGGLYVTDTIVYYGTGININNKVDDADALFYSNEVSGARTITGDAFAKLDTVQFTFNPADSVLSVELISEYSGLRAKFYVAGNMTEWEKNKIAVYEDTYKMALEAGVYQLKIIVDEKWLGFNDLTDKSGLVGDKDDNICFALLEAGNVTITYTGKVYTVTGDFIAVPEIPDGYYLIGTHVNWYVPSVAPYRFKADPDNDGEYILTTTLTVGQEFKVIDVKGNQAVEWYPKESGNYVVDAKHAGENKVVHFSPKYNADWEGYIYVAPNKDEEALDLLYDGSKPVKIMKNGYIYILRGDKMYDVTGKVVQ
jgi:hypothetical protein